MIKMIDKDETSLHLQLMTWKMSQPYDYQQNSWGSLPPYIKLQCRGLGILTLLHNVAFQVIHFSLSSDNGD